MEEGDKAGLSDIATRVLKDALVNLGISTVESRIQFSHQHFMEKIYNEITAVDLEIVDDCEKQLEPYIDEETRTIRLRYKETRKNERKTGDKLS